MKLLTFALGNLYTNCYVLINEQTNMAIAIDIGGDDALLKLEELKHRFNIVEKKNVPKELRFYGKSHTLVLGKRHYDMIRERKDVEFDITLYDTYDTHPIIDSLTKPETIQRDKRWFDIQFPKAITTISIDNDIVDDSPKAWVFKNIPYEYAKTCQIPYRFILVMLMALIHIP